MQNTVCWPALLTEAQCQTMLSMQRHAPASHASIRRWLNAASYASASLVVCMSVTDRIHSMKSYSFCTSVWKSCHLIFLPAGCSFAIKPSDSKSAAYCFRSSHVLRRHTELTCACRYEFQPTPREESEFHRSWRPGQATSTRVWSRHRRSDGVFLMTTCHVCPKHLTAAPLVL